MTNFSRLSAGFFFACVCLGAHALDLEVIGGSVRASGPPCGTWHECKSDTPATFQLGARTWGFGVAGDLTSWARWTVAYEDLGAQSARAVAYNDTPHLSSFDSFQHPRTVCGTFEPRIGVAFAQIGACGYQDRFTEDMPNYWWQQGGRRISYEVGNRHWYPGPLLGVGVSMGSVDVVANYRIIKAQDGTRDGLQTSWQALSHSAIGLFLRLRTNIL